MKGPLFASVKLNIKGPDGNALNIVAVVRNCMRQAGFDNNDITDVTIDMMSDDYQHLCDVAGKYICIESHEQEVI